MPTGVYHRTAEARANIGKASKRAFAEGRHTAPWKGKKFSEAHKKKLSIAALNRRRTKSEIAQCRALGLSGKGKKASPETLKKMSLAQKGREVSPETRLKISIAKTGRKNGPPSEETKQKIGSAQRGVKREYRGERHHNWKGGVSSENRIERQRFRKNIQSQVLKRDNYTCQICDQYSGSLQVDHIKSWADYPDLRFELDNCRTLCMACHYYVTFKRKIPQGVIWGHNLSRGVL